MCSKMRSKIRKWHCPYTKLLTTTNIDTKWFFNALLHRFYKFPGLPLVSKYIFFLILAFSMVECITKQLILRALWRWNQILVAKAPAEIKDKQRNLCQFFVPILMHCFCMYFFTLGNSWINIHSLFERNIDLI